MSRSVSFGKTLSRRLLPLGLLATLGMGLILATVGCGCGDDSSNSSSSSASQSGATSDDWHNKPLEYKLARLDEGSDPPDGDIKVARFKSLLGQLSETFKENQTQIGDMTVSAQEQMKKEGVEEPLLDIMVDMNQVFTRKVPNQSHAEYVSAYVVMREKGNTREKSVAALRGLLVL